MYNEKGVSGKGATTNSYDSNKIVVNMRQRYGKSIAIKNTDSTNSLKFKVNGYFTKNELTYEEIQKEVTVAAGEIKTVLFDGIPFDHFNLYLKSAVDGAHATYSYEYLLGN